MSMYKHEELREAQALASRLARAEALAKAGVGTVEPMDGAYLVTSRDGTKKYVVGPDGRCTCPDWEYRHELHNGRCKHRLAVLVYEEALRDAEAKQVHRKQREHAAQPVSAAA
jgi:hypothetical protein